MRYFALLFLLIAGCASKPQDKAADSNVKPDQQQALKNLVAQAEEAGRAAVQEDHAKMAELTLPALVEKFGGRAMYVQKLASIAAEMKGKGFQLKQFSIGKPSHLVEAVGGVYAVVPGELELSGPEGAIGKQPAYMVAVSQYEGISWKFIDGAGAGGDRGRLKALLPNFPDELQLPNPQPAVWDNNLDKAVRLPDPPKTFARPAFTFNYPTTWAVKEKDNAYDPDHLFIIDASFAAMIMFAITDAELDPSKLLAANIRAQSKRMANPVLTEFTNWGQYTGRGAVVRGTVLFFAHETIRVFVFNEGGKTYTVTECFPNDEEEQLAPGYRTIAESFRVLQPENGKSANAAVHDN